MRARAPHVRSERAARLAMSDATILMATVRSRRIDAPVHLAHAAGIECTSDLGTDQGKYW